MHIGSAVAIAAFVLFVWIVGHATIGQWAAIHYGPIVSFVSCLMILGALQPSPFSRVLGWRPFAQVGRVSYSVYLWHVPVLAFVPDARLAAVPISLVIACVSCRYVERPFRGKRKAASLAEASHRAVLPATT